MLSETMSYSDKFASITFIGGALFKVLHTYKLDDNLYKQAQDELLPSILDMKDEFSINTTFSLLLDYLEKTSKVLRKWT
jgi:hypothetical protein